MPEKARKVSKNMGFRTVWGGTQAEDEVKEIIGETKKNVEAAGVIVKAVS